MNTVSTRQRLPFHAGRTWPTSGARGAHPGGQPEARSRGAWPLISAVQSLPNNSSRKSS